MAFEHLRVRRLTRITSSWGNGVVDALNLLYGNWEELSKRGTVADPWDLFYGYYGYFYYDLFVQGKRVVKDGDPINIYDILEPARQSITKAINSSKVPSSTDIQELYNIVAREETQQLIKQYLEELHDVQSYYQQRIRESVEQVKDKILKLQLDEYGRLGVIISEPIDEYGYVKVNPRDIDEDLIPVSDVINTATATSPVTVITPSLGKRVDIRRAYLSTDSTNGKIYLKFANTGKVIVPLYPTKYGFAIVPAIRSVGEVDEPVILEWSGVDTGSEIYYAINYKEV